jgi:hypothetical protein
MRPTPLGRRSAVLGALALGVPPLPDEPLDESDFLSGGLRIRFRDVPRLHRGAFYPQPARPLDDPGFVWRAGYVHATASPGTPAYVPPGTPWPAFSWLSSERAVYPNADAIAVSGFCPLQAGDDGLALVARPTPPGVVPNIPPGFARDFVSAALNSYPFSQRYGYFEARARVPAGRGLWPAFWLLPVDLSWPPEADVMEVLGQDPRTLYTTVHSRSWPDGTMRGHGTRGADLSAAMHRFGMDWGPERVCFYLDRKRVFSQPTPRDWHKPFYLLLNLGVGGPKSWPGAPDAQTRFPARFVVAEVLAVQRRRYLLDAP